MGVENAISSSVTTSSPSISSSPSLGGEIGSSFSFASTVPLSAPAEISLGGTFSSASFLDYSPMAAADLGPISLDTPIPSVFETGLADINLDPDLPNYEIPEAFRIGLAEVNLDPDVPDSDVPQAFHDAFSDQELLDPISYSEEINIVDIPNMEAQIETIEQLDYSIEPEISQTEAKLAEIFEEPLTAPKVEILAFQGDALELHLELQNNQHKNTGVITEIPIGLAEVIVKPEIAQATVTYESLKTAGIGESEAITLTQNALVLTGAKPEVAEQTMVQIAIGTKTTVEIESDIEREGEPSYAKASVGEEKKIELKFVVDEKALQSRNEALKQAVEMVSPQADMGEDIIDSSSVAVLMPSEVRNPGVLSGILPKYFIELLNHGDGAYRLAVRYIKDLGKQSRQKILEKGLEINSKLPSVTVALNGEEVGKPDIERVLSYQPSPITG